MVWREVVIAALLSVCVTSGGAQMAVGSKVSPAKAFDSQLSVIESEMMGAVKAMPAEKFGFAPSAAIFVKPSSISVRAVASANLRLSIPQLIPYFGSLALYTATTV